MFEVKLTPFFLRKMHSDEKKNTNEELNVFTRFSMYSDGRFPLARELDLQHLTLASSISPWPRVSHPPPQAEGEQTIVTGRRPPGPSGLVVVDEEVNWAGWLPESCACLDLLSFPAL